jgi:hypothetical protein
VLDDIARRAAPPAEKLLTTSFRLAGWVAGRAISPVLWGVRQVGPPVLETVARISPAAGQLISALLPSGRPDHSTDSWRPATPVRPAHLEPTQPAGRVPTEPTEPPKDTPDMR